MISAAQRNPIQLLPEHLIDQIKAGEVIERPANVLKELIENAIDAAATQIDVELKDNGLTLLRVSDNGYGIPADEIMTAFGRHATSKITSFEDLYRLHSFGFRGEALPSVASVSRLECVSWTKGSSTGGSLRYEGGLPGQVVAVTKSGKDFGTIMTVQDLFYNTPARLKFLQSATSEKNWLKKFFYAFVLTYPEISFSLQWDNDERLFYPATSSRAERVKQLFSQKAHERIRICEATRQWQGLSCQVVAIFHQGAKSQGPLEHVIVNNRPVLDKAYARVTQQVLEKQQLAEFPTLLIFLDVPADQIDVNVHPNKTMVKFHQMSEILSLVSATLREALPVQARVSVETQNELVIPTHDHKPAIDLQRDRAESYATHQYRIQESMNLEDEIHIGPKVLHYEKGPYFIWLLPQQSHPVYIDGRALLGQWLLTKKDVNQGSTPLLVSHPLRDLSLTSTQIKSLQGMGFEIDSLEKNFHVVREIPTWSQGIPLRVLMPMLLNQVVSEIEFHEISLNFWESIWSEVTLAGIADKLFSIQLSPQVFGKKS